MTFPAVTAAYIQKHSFVLPPPHPDWVPPAHAQKWRWSQGSAVSVCGWGGWYHHGGWMSALPAWGDETILFILFLWLIKSGFCGPIKREAMGQLWFQCRRELPLQVLHPWEFLLSHLLGTAVLWCCDSVWAWLQRRGPGSTKHTWGLWWIIYSPISKGLRGSMEIRWNYMFTLYWKRPKSIVTHWIFLIVVWKYHLASLY